MEVGQGGQSGQSIVLRSSYRDRGFWHSARAQLGQILDSLMRRKTRTCITTGGSKRIKEQKKKKILDDALSPVSPCQPASSIGTSLSAIGPRAPICPAELTKLSAPVLLRMNRGPDSSGWCLHAELAGSQLLRCGLTVGMRSISRWSGPSLRRRSRQVAWIGGAADRSAW